MMNARSFTKFTTFAAAVSLFLSANASAAIDDAAAVVLVRQSCTENQVILDNCFTDLASLNTWIVFPRQPDATNPLLIDIGPGTFNGPLNCINQSNISVRGSGRNITTISNRMVLNNCDELDVADIRITGGYGGVQWSGTGHTKWTNVEIAGAGRGWYETGGSCPDPDNTSHYWYSSKIMAEPLFSLVIPYNANCGENWFYGSELLAHAINTLNLSPFSSNGWGSLYPISVGGNSEAHIYGSSIRTVVPSTSSPMGSAAARTATVDGELHIHGTGIDVLSDIAVPVTVLTTNGGTIHANETAYNLRTGGGQTITRIVNNGGSVSAPFQWKENTEPPAINSVNGADMAVETDCDATGCQSSGSETHLLIYNNNCVTDGPWFDVVTGACRGQ